MALWTYQADLRSLSDDEFARVYELLNSWAYTGLTATSTLKVYRFFLEENDVDILQSLPQGVWRRLA